MERKSKVEDLSLLELGESADDMQPIYTEEAQ